MPVPKKYRGLTQLQWMLLRSRVYWLAKDYLTQPQLKATFQACWVECHANLYQCYFNQPLQYV
jgi:hypothetical protein